MRTNTYSILPAVILFTALAAHAGEKTVMHCFAWTAVKQATPADWDGFYKASDALPKKIKGITKVWYGKLQEPFNWTGVVKAEPEALQKLRAGQAATAEVQRSSREYGMCMEFATPDALKAYDTDPYHKVWTDAYAKVRVEGTTTFNIIGQ